MRNYQKLLKKLTRVLAVISATTVLVLCVFSYVYLVEYPTNYQDYVNKNLTNNIDNKYLVLSIIKAESNFNKNAKSKAGAIGLMQILPETAKYVAELYNVDDYNLLNAYSNIKLGIKYLDYLKNKFNNIDTAICAYNAGEGVVLEWLKNSAYSKDGKTLYKIPYKETENYLNKIKKFYKVYCFLYL